jgi:RHS repeat-associated protein
MTSYAYDPVGHLVSTTDPLGHVTSTTFDATGNKLTSTDGSGNTTHWSYDSDNRVISETAPNGVVTATSYDGNGNKISTTDGNGGITSYQFDSANRETGATDPGGRTTTYGLDADGNQVAVTDPSGRVTTKSYDALNRLISVSYSDGSTPGVTYSYNADGGRTSMSDGTGTTAYAYDSLQRLISAVNGAGRSTSYGYDLDGHVTSLTYPNGKVVTQSFDADGRLTRVSDWLGNTSSFTYDADGNQISGTLGIVTDASVFNSADQVNSISDQLGKKVLQRFSYARDADALVTSTTSGNSTENFSYDSMNQLASDSKNTFGYDAAGNLIRTVKNTPLSYDGSDQLLASGNAKKATTFTFDAEGERTSVSPPKGAATLYGYDQAGHMTSLTQGTASTLYSYNGDGLRMAKQSGSSTTEFTWDTDVANPLLLSDGSTNYIYGPQGLPIESVDSVGVTTFYHHDQLGSTTMLTSVTGKKEALFAYNSFGLVQKVSGAASTPLLFAGQYRDSESGLYYLQARYYDPSTGQFMEIDPLVAQTGTPYSYGSNDPINNSDPSGQSWWNPNTWSPLTQLIVGQVPGAAGGALGAFQGAAQIAQSWASTAGTCNRFSNACVGAVFGSLDQTIWSGGLVLVGIAYGTVGRLIADGNYLITGQQLDSGQLCG